MDIPGESQRVSMCGWARRRRSPASDGITLGAYVILLLITFWRLNSIIERARIGGFFSAARLNGFHSVIGQYLGIEVVGTLAADWSREKGRQAAEEFLRANPPGTLDVIWAASGEMGLGAMLAVEAAQVKWG